MTSLPNTVELGRIQQKDKLNRSATLVEHRAEQKLEQNQNREPEETSFISKPSSNYDHSHDNLVTMWKARFKLAGMVVAYGTFLLVIVITLISLTKEGNTLDSKKQIEILASMLYKLLHSTSGVPYLLPLSDTNSPFMQANDRNSTF